MHEAKKYHYAWMSFSEHEGQLLQNYLNEEAQKGNEVRKIARYYIRFKHQNHPIEPFYVQNYRKHFFGHLYWRFSHEPFENIGNNKSRLQFNLSMLVFMGLLLFASLISLVHFDYRLLYSDGMLSLSLCAPFFAFSFFLDYLGRSLESYHPTHHGYQFAHFRAIYLSLNMFLRYSLLFGLVIPMFLKELRVQVVFIVLMVSIYELAYYYLPHRFSRHILIGSSICAMLVCQLLTQIQNQLPYQKDKVDYSQFEVLRLENMIHPKEFDESLNYKRCIHRYTTVSMMIPLSYSRTEMMQAIDGFDVFYQVHTSLAYCRDQEIAKYVYKGKKNSLDQEKIKVLDADAWQVEEILMVEKQQILVRIDDVVLEFSGNFDFTETKLQNTLVQMIQKNIQNKQKY